MTKEEILKEVSNKPLYVFKVVIDESNEDKPYLFFISKEEAIRVSKDFDWFAFVYPTCSTAPCGVVEQDTLCKRFTSVFTKQRVADSTIGIALGKYNLSDDRHVHVITSDAETGESLPRFVNLTIDGVHMIDPSDEDGRVYWTKELTQEATDGLLNVF